MNELLTFLCVYSDPKSSGIQLIINADEEEGGQT